ncbi:MAG: ABC transporter substrate-binding protein [bacterium]|nr:ABC transporter substrate-binding protein [bacterium]
MRTISKYFRWPKASQWKQFFGILNPKERIVFFVFLFFFLLSSSSLAINFYFKNTEILAAEGGSLAEGVLGSPRLINPVYAAANDTDRDLSELIFSGLMKYDSQGKIVADLAKSYQILEEGKIYEFELKENLLWSDGKPLNADDIIFTIKIIQNPDYKSPLRSNWLGVEAEKISDSAVRFKLKNPSAIFLENATLKVLPKHIWESISSANFPLVIYNLKPVGSGPFKLKSLQQDDVGKILSLNLVKNAYYFGKSPNITQISFKFFGSEEDLITSYKKGEISNFSLNSLSPDLPDSAKLHSASLPRYFAVFFNPQKAKIFSDKNVRQALNYGLDKQKFVEAISGQKGGVIDSPILPDAFGYESPTKTYEFNFDKAKNILETSKFLEGENGLREKTVKKEAPFQFKSNLKSGSQGTEVKELQKCLEVEVTGYFGDKTKEAVISFQEKYSQDILKPNDLTKGTGEVLKSTRDKLNQVCFGNPEEKILLKFTLVTSDHPQLQQAAEILKEQWRALGADVEIKTYDIGTLEREIIKNRNYDALLFGEILGGIPDPFPFWHSSQKKDPGLNLALYENKDADKLLQEARETMDENIRKEKLEKFQNLLLEDAPAVFLFNPSYFYFASSEIKGISLKMILDPSKRFSDIESWYIKTRRAWK